MDIEECSTQHPVVYLKKTVELNNRYWFWHNKLGVIISRRGMQEPWNYGYKKIPQYSAHPYRQAREVQVGDTVFINHPKVRALALLLGEENIPNGKVFRCHTNSGEVIDVASKYLTLVTNNLKLVCKAPEHNKLFARSELELHFVELLSYERAVRKYNDEYGTMDFDKNSLTALHNELFSEIYEWGGRIRNEEVVVGDRDAPTENPENIEQALDDFFSMFNRKYKSNTISHLNNVISGVVDLNMYLNWIHPFKDGNGRSIRLFSQLFALQNGFKLDWKFLETRSGKKKYHYSIRKAVYYFNEAVADSRLKQSKHLHELIREAITKLK